MKMGYKCNNCNIDFPDKRGIVEHMIDVHGSPYIEGDWAKVSDSILTEKGKTELKDKVKKARGE